MPVCPTCKKKMNLLDWANHRSEHMTEAQKERAREEMRKWDRAHPRKMKPEEDVFKGFRDE